MSLSLSIFAMANPLLSVQPAVDTKYCPRGVLVVKKEADPLGNVDRSAHFLHWKHLCNRFLAIGARINSVLENVRFDRAGSNSVDTDATGAIVYCSAFRKTNHLYGVKLYWESRQGCSVLLTACLVAEYVDEDRTPFKPAIEAKLTIAQDL